MTPLEKIVERYHTADRMIDRMRWYDLVLKIIEFRTKRNKWNKSFQLR